MMAPHTKGFTIVELLVSITILALGVLAVAAGTVYTTRNLSRSRLATVAAAQGTSKLDELLSYARATSPPCGAANFASSVTPVIATGVTLTWTVPPTGSLRTIQVRAQYRLARTGLRTDTLTARVAC